MELFFFFFLLSIITGMYANKLNRSGIGYFIASLLVSPLIIFFILLLIGQNEDPMDVKNINASNHDKKDSSNIDKIEKLAKLLENGHLTREEFVTEKRLLLKNS